MEEFQTAPLRTTQIEPPKEDGRIFAVLFATVFATILGIGLVVPMMPAYAQNLKASGLWIGIMLASFSVARLTLIPFIGAMSDRTGRKRFILIGLVIYMAAALGYMAAEDILQLSLARFVNGVGSAMVIPICMAYAGDIAPSGKEGRYMGTINMGLFLGMGAGPALGGALTDAFSMNAAFWALFGLTLGAFVLAFFWLAERPAAMRRTEPAAYSAILKNKLVAGLLIFRLVSEIGRGAAMGFLPLLAGDKGFTHSQIGVLVSWYILITGALQRPFGKLADRMSRPALMGAGSALMSVAFASYPLFDGFWGLMFVGLFFGLGGAISMPAASAVSVDAGTVYGMGSVMALFSMAMSGGLIIAPLLAGTMKDLFGINYVFYVGGFVSLVGCFAVLPFLTKRRIPNAADKN